MNKTGVLTRIFYGILCAVGVFLFAFPLTLNVHVASTKEQAINTRQFQDYRHAMNQYHGRYGRFPVHSTNIVELARVLDGEDINGDNPGAVKFFAKEMPLEKRVRDGWGFPFELSADASGTNFFLRSYGSKKYREHRTRNSTPLVYNISQLYTQTLAQAEAEARAQIQTYSVTNRPVIKRKETNHVNSTSQ